MSNETSPETPLPAEPAAPPVAPAAETAPAITDMAPAAVAAKLGELFPALFGAQPPKPLKLRIQADIQQRAPGLFTKKSLSVYLHRLTTGTPYLVALTQSPGRFDLDGQPAGELAAEHREAAATELARRRALQQQRRAAEHEARRQAQQQERQAQAAQHAADHEARRDRAALLRAFETTTLTRANFCALKGIADAALDTLLAQARSEREQRPPMPPREMRPDNRADRRPQEPRRDGRPPHNKQARGGRPPQRPQRAG